MRAYGSALLSVVSAPSSLIILTLEPVLQAGIANSVRRPALELTHINARKSTDGLYLTINSQNSERYPNVSAQRHSFLSELGERTDR